jgi:hypothetical protein
MIDISVSQPLVVAVSRAGLVAGATPSPATPLDTAHSQLRGVVPQTAAVLPPSNAVVAAQAHLRSDHTARDGSAPPVAGVPQSTVEQCFRPQTGAGAVPLSTGSGMNAVGPLGIVVSTDVGLGKVRTDMAQNLISSSTSSLGFVGIFS